MLNIFTYVLITVYFTNQPSDIRENEKQVLNDVSVLIKDLSSGKLEKDDFEKKITNTEMKFQEIKNAENLLLERNTLIGSSGLGFLFGLVIDLNLHNEINPIIPPLTSAILLTSTMYFVLNNEKAEVVAEYSKNYIGRSTVSISESIKNLIYSYIKDQKQSLELKKQNTIEYIQSIPDNTRKNINNYVETKTNEIKTTIEQIPKNVQNSIETKIDDIKKETNNAIQVQIINVQALPEKTILTIKNSFQATTAKLIALPGIIYAKTKLNIELKITETQNKFNSKINLLKKSLNELNPFSSRNVNSEIKSVPKSGSIAVNQSKKDLNVESKVFPISNNAKPNTPLKVEIKAESKQPETKVDVKAIKLSTSNTPTKPAFSVGNFMSKAPTTAPVKVESKQPENKVDVKAIKLSTSSTPTKPTFSVGNFMSKAPTTAPVKVESKQPETKVDVKAIKLSTSSTPTKPTFSVGNFLSKAPTTAPVKVESKQPETKVFVKVPKAIISAPKSNPAVLKESNSNVDVRNLNSKLVKLINSVSKRKPTAIKDIDIALGNYISTKSGPETFYRELVVSLNSKDEAFTILPDIIGILPNGPLKKALNSFYQQSA